MKKENRSQEVTEDQELVEMGKFYFVNGKYDEAVEEFKKALKVNPGSPEIFYNLGLVYESRNKPEEAIKMYKKALAIDPKYKLAKQHYEKLIGL
ncbi:MAG: tetratricopeptide repeat protein [Elusimicrobia bacterium]|nr:tetratricopeptide repeat protein [Elusimicrobiota bacterium]